MVFSLDSLSNRADMPSMATQFVTVEINLATLVIPLQAAIEAQLNEQGEPLRWAITSVSSGIVQVEAVVLQNLTN
jgi:uncharacterized membrane protein YdcZ (DUF606 family)